MAKKKTPEPTALTPDQYKLLGQRMLTGGGNIFTVAKMMFGVTGGDELFDGVKLHSGACKCEMCDRWKGSNEMAEGMTGDVCEECVSGDDTDGDE